MLLNRARFVHDRCPNIMTYQGTYIDNRYVALFDLVDNNVPEEKLITAFVRDFNMIKHIFAADTIRVVLRPFYPREDNNGFQFPVPSPLERAFLRTLIKAVRICDMKFFPVFVLPDRAGYAWKHPNAVDDFYAKNNRTLWSNYEQYVKILLSEIDGFYSYLDVFGDFDPLNIYNNKLHTELYFHQLWFHAIHAAFGNLGFAELVGSVDKPETAIPDEIAWLKYNSSNRTPYAFQLYTDNQNYTHDFLTIIQKAADAAGGSQNILIEETGSNTTDFTDDGDEGRSYYRAVFSARNAVDPKIPVGLWAFGSAISPDGEWGWSFNRNVWEIRPCWWFICEGSSGLMWNIDDAANTATVQATRLQANYLVIPFKKDIAIKRVSSWGSHVKFADVAYGSAFAIHTRDENFTPSWWPKGESVETFVRPQAAWDDCTHLWLAVDFNWVDPNLSAAITVLP